MKAISHFNKRELRYKMNIFDMLKANIARRKNRNKLLFGDRRPEKYIPIKTQEDIEIQRNVMGILDGRYPLSMSDCFVVGINGDCGNDCPVFLAGKCEV